MTSMWTASNSVRRTAASCITRWCSWMPAAKRRNGRRQPGWKLSLFRRARISGRWIARWMGARTHSAAARSGAFAAHSQGHGRGDSDPLPSVRKARAGPIVARIELLRPAHQGPHVDPACSIITWISRPEIRTMSPRPPLTLPRDVQLAGHYSACALSLQGHESDGNVAGWIHEAADLDQGLGFQLAKRLPV